MKVRLLILLCLLLPQVRGEESIKVQDKKKEKVNKKKVKSTVSFSTSFNTDFKQFDDINKSFTNSSGLRLSLSFPQNWALSTALFFDKSFKGERRGEIRDTFIGVRKSIPLDDHGLRFSTNLNLYLPISKISREITYLNTAYRLAFILGLNFKGIGAPNLGGYIRFDFLHNFHRSNTNAYGSSNYQYTGFLLAGLDYSFGPKWNLSFDFNFFKRCGHISNSIFIN